MRVRCRATADYRSNAVGKVELDCTPAGLSVALRGVSSYREGYAPGPPAKDVEVCVPWPSVYATRLGEEGLLLSVAATLMPLNRFRLGEFAEVVIDVGGAAARRRRLLTVLGGSAGALLALMLALSARGALPEPHVLRTLAAALVLAACVVFFARRASGGRRLAPHEVLRDFSEELARHLPNHLPMEPITVPPRSLRLPDLAALLPRSAVGVAITLAAASLAALVSSTAARPEPTRAEPSGVSALASWAAPLRQAAPESSSPPPPSVEQPDPPAATPLGAPCACPRAESLLWREPLPRLAALVIGSRARAHEEHLHMEVDVAIVNDGDRPTDLIDASVLFFEQRPAPARGQHQTGERRLRLERPLPPGGVMKWHVEARGSAFDLVGPDLGALASDGSDAAPAEAFASLTGEQSRVLRLHGARLLAFVGDDRAQAAARALESSATAGEEAFLQRLVQAPAAVATCGVEVSRASERQWQVRACLDNHSEQSLSHLDLRLLAYDAGFDPQRPGARAPSLLGDQPAPLDVELAAHSGRALALTVPLSIPSGALPRAFELTLAAEEK